MKFFIAIQGPVGVALDQVLSLLLIPNHVVCYDLKEADLIFVENKQQLQEFYDENKFFAVFSIKEIKHLSDNARWIPILDYLVPMTAYVTYVQEELSSREDIDTQDDYIETGKQFPPLKASQESQRILVIDDKSENRNLAMELLNTDHDVTLASGYDEGLRLVRTNRYDVVLSDCQMMPETKNSPLSVDAIVIGQTVHIGIFLIFHATKRGSRIAIVTDANHHSDWVSALFDDKDLRDHQEVNGQPVLLINYMGKRWDKALVAINAL